MRPTVLVFLYGRLSPLFSLSSLLCDGCGDGQEGTARMLAGWPRRARKGGKGKAEGCDQPHRRPLLNDRGADRRGRAPGRAGRARRGCA